MTASLSPTRGSAPGGVKPPSSSSAALAHGHGVSGTLGFINFSPRKLRLPDQHKPWGTPYQHPTIVTPSGKTLAEVAAAQQLAATLAAQHPIPVIQVDGQVMKPGGGIGNSKKKSSKKKTTFVSHHPTDEQKENGGGVVPDAGEVESVELEDGDTEDDDSTPSPSRSPSHKLQVEEITSKIINTVAPPAAPYTAFSEASRYHDIIHPPISPRSLLLSKLAAPSEDTPAQVRDGLPLAPLTWHLTSKLPPPRPSANTGALSSLPADGFDATLAQRDQRLFGGLAGPRGKSAGSDHAQRVADRQRRVEARASLAAKQALALSMGLLPGDRHHDAGPWKELHLTPRPRTSNDARGRKEVLRMLDAFRHAPKGTTILAQREEHHHHPHHHHRETGETLPTAYQPRPPTVQRSLRSAPSGQQLKIPFSPRSFQRAQFHQQQQQGFGLSALSSSAPSRSHTSHGSSRPAFGSSSHSESQRAHARSPISSSRTVPVTPSGFFPSSTTATGASTGAGVSSFHSHLSSMHRSTGGVGTGLNPSSSIPSTSAFHRVLPPSFMNVPKRVENLSIDSSRASRERLRLQAQSQEQRWAFQGEIVKERQGASQTARRATSQDHTHANTNRAITRASVTEDEKEASAATNTASSYMPSSAPAPLPLPSELDLSSTLAQIRDYEVRARACERAGRRAAEANAQYCMGVLYDNIQQYRKAIECYQRFKHILCGPKVGKVGGDINDSHSSAGPRRPSEDNFAAALAHNSLGVSFQNMGPEYYQQALYHHACHRDIADLPGQFIAYTNMGLIYQLMANQAQREASVPSSSPSSPLSSLHWKQLTEQAAYNHQQALRCGIQMSSLAGQNIAIGNLGLTGLQHHDLETARACMERHLQLSQNLDDYRGQSSAYQILGTIASQQGQHEEAMVYYQSAQQMANVLKETATADSAKVAVGVAKANAQMDAYMRHQAAMMLGQDVNANNNSLQ